MPTLMNPEEAQSALRGEIDVDWQEVERVAALPAYDCAAVVCAMKQEVEASLALKSA